MHTAVYDADSKNIITVILFLLILCTVPATVKLFNIVLAVTKPISISYFIFYLNIL